MQLNKKTLDYKWVIVAVCFLMECVCLGFCSSNKSLYLGAITEALGIKRSLFSINDSFRFVTSAVVNLFFGNLVQRFGVRKMTAFGFVALICSMLIYAYATNIFVFYIGGILLGAGLAFTTTAMVSILVKRWCPTNTGTFLGIVLAANGLGGALAAQIVTPIIYEEGNPFGYRNAYSLVAVLLAIVAVLAVLLLREAPRGTQQAQVSNKKKPRGGGWIGMEYQEALKRPYFIPSAIGIFLTGMVLSGINGIGGAHLKDVGLDAGFVGTVLSAHSLALLAFKFLAGVCYDRKGLRTMLNICMITGVIVTVMLALVTNSTVGMVLGMLWGVFSSLALPMETIGVSLVTSDLYGNKAFDKMVGLMLALNHLGYAVGNPLANVFYDLNGSYTPVAIGSAVLLAVVTIVYQFIITAAHKDRKAIEAAQTK